VPCDHVDSEKVIPGRFPEKKTFDHMLSLADPSKIQAKSVDID
jgi:hypothetical protein